MPRAARDKSSTGIYHVMLRGVNHQIIFEDDEDYQKFLRTLKHTKEKSGYIIYAYCLMSNHIHLLIKEAEEDLGIVFRRIGASYVYWYNRKYGRRGHLFQDRYKSEAVETDSYFLTVLRYIHQNPYNAGIVENIADYPWSSYHEYIEEPRLCDTEFGLSLFSSDRVKAIKLFEEFNLAENQDRCLDYDQGVRLNDMQATDFIKSICDVQSPSEIALFEKGKRNKIIKQCREKGLSIRQIERLTGISFGVIRGVDSR
ncbi:MULTISPECIES: transposase [Tepidanaerobacter]|uniref:transposase n=1 Tax=Tepidanaerobacter TaxID=499228 RepID=UPI000B093F83|nr:MULTISPECIES: transposase [Tepidanaerobacter]